MLDESSKVSAVSSNKRVDQGVRGDFAVPLGSTTRGRLIFASGAADVTIDATPNSSLLYSAHFERHIPSVRVQDGIVTIQYRRYLLFDWLAYLAEPLARVALNTTIPWEIEFRDGVSRLTADLRTLQLAALDMSSVNIARITLPAPVGSANIYFSGSASDLTLHRPPGVALRLQIAGSASCLTLDEQRLGAIGGGIRWQSEDYNDAVNRYDIRIAGSVSNMTIDTQDTQMGTK